MQSVEIAHTTSSTMEIGASRSRLAMASTAHCTRTGPSPSLHQKGPQKSILWSIPVLWEQLAKGDGVDCYRAITIA